MLSITKNILLLLFCLSCAMLMISPVMTLNRGISQNHINSKCTKYLLLIVTSLLVFAAVVKPTTMADYSSYVRLFQGSDQNERMEPAFSIVVRISELIGGDFLTLFLIFALISITLRVYFLYKCSPIIWGSMAVYLSNIYILHDLIQIRAAVASALLFLVVYFSYKRNLKLFFITLCVSLCFHFSSIMYILVWFVSGKNNPMKYIIIVFLSYFFYFTHINLITFISYVPFLSISSLLTSYAGRDIFDINVFNLVQMGRIIMAFIFFYNINSGRKKMPWFLYFLKIYIIGLCFLPLFSSLHGASLRMMELFVSCETIVVPVGFLMTFKNPIISKLAIITYAVFIFNIYYNAGNYWEFDWINY